VIALRRGDTGYPTRLLDLREPPDPLWIDGDLSIFEGRAAAIVGTRRMSGYGERVARDLAAACAGAGIVVVSGLAQGIDAAAHRGALDGGGRTIAVLGEGITLFVTTVRGRRRPLVPRIRAQGALVAQYAPAFCAQPWMFAKRNATIAALADVVVVVEAGERSGALITAGDAIRLGRPLHAVPGPLGSAASVGTNALIATGRARAINEIADLVRACGAPAGPRASESDPVLDALLDGPLGIDELSRRARLPLGALSSRVATLALRGRVAPLPDGRLRRV
jgi:DNA processing protein